MKKIIFSLFIVLGLGNFAFCDPFTELIQDLAVQTACLGVYSSTEAGYTSGDPHDYYTPSMMAERFAVYSGDRTRTETFYGICFDYANCAYEYIEKFKSMYTMAGMKENQFWIAIVASDTNEIELSNPVSPEEGTQRWNGVDVKTYGDESYIRVKSHGDNTTYHAWIWIQRNDGVWFWIDPTWTDTAGYVVYGYVGNGKEIQCKPSTEYCVNYPWELNSLPEPPKVSSKVAPNTSNYRDPVLVDEECYIKNQQGLYWTFTVPEDADSVSIECDSSAEFSWKMDYAVFNSLDDVKKFYNGEEFRCIVGSYVTKTQDYSMELKNLTPGETYYFCAVNRTKGITAAKQYKLQVKIIAY